MSFAVLLYGIAMALVAWVVHCLWWRVRRPQDDLKALAWCMAAVPVVLMALLCSAGKLPVSSAFLSLFLAEALGAAYLFWYPAAQAVSPTMLIVLLAQRAGEAGLTENSLKEAVSEEVLTGETINNLFHEQFARTDPSGGIFLAARGRRTLKVIRWLRHSAGFTDPKG